jgi:uncharacterized protein with gpF-like domain
LATTSTAFFDFNLEPKEAMVYLSGKGLKLSFNYDELMHEAHHKAFTVAKVTSLDLQKDIYESLLKAQKAGTPFEAWKKELVPTLLKYGWWGETTVTNPKTGEAKDIYVGAKRLRNIYYTNMRVANSVGRYEQMMALDSAVYWRYVSLWVGENRRQSHKAIHGMIRHRDDPFWRVNYPPNGWGCKCKVQAYTASQIANRGWNISGKNDALPKGYDGPHPDWAYDVGVGSNLTKIYQNKVTGLKGLHEVGSTQLKKDIATLSQNDKLFKEIQPLFDEKNKTVELCESAIFGDKKRVLLSSDTVQTHHHHDDITAFDYSLIPLMLDGEKRIFKQSDTRFILLTKLGNSYRLTLKDVKKTDEIYAVSLLKITDFEKELKKLSRFEEVEE